MESTPRPVLPGDGGPPRPGQPDVRRSGRRRRPTGQPPPLPRSIQPTGVWWAAAAVVLIALARITFGPARGSLGVAVTVWDDAVVRWLAGLRLPGLTGLMEAIVASTGSVGTVEVLRWATVIALLALRRFRHLLVFVGSFLAVLLAVRLATVDRPRPFGVDHLGSWAGWAMPSRPVAILTATLVGVLYTLVPEGRWRQLGKWVAAGLVAAFALARVHLGVDAPTDALLAAVIGVAVSVAAYRLFVPNEIFPVTYKRGRSAHLDVSGRRGQAIRHALADQLGLTALDVEPFGQAGSAGSTPLRIQLQDQAGTTRHVFGKLYARSHLRADRSYKLWRALLYGRLEDEKPFHTVKRLVQQEDYALALMHRAGLPSPEPYGVAELTPEREYLIVFEFIDGATEIGEAEVDDAIIDQGLAIIRKLWDANLAHRDIKPANLLVRDGKLYLIDVFFAEIHPSPWRQAVDLANMLLCLALRSSPQQVYQRASAVHGRRDQRGLRRRPRARAAVPAPQADARPRTRPSRRVRAPAARGTPPDRRPALEHATRHALACGRAGAASRRRPAGLAVRPLQRQPRRRRRRRRRDRGLHPDRGTVAPGTGRPSASHIPCVQALPANIISALAVRDGESTLELGHASLDISLIAGEWPRARAVAGSVTIRLTPTCAVRRPGTARPSRRASHASSSKDPPAHPRWSTCSPAAVSTTSRRSASARRPRCWTRPSGR